MNAAAFGGAGTFQSDLADLIVDRAFFPSRGPYPRTAADFQKHVRRARGLVSIAVQDVIDLVDPIMAASAAARKSMKAARAPAWASSVEDGKTQLRELTAAGFLKRTPWGWLQQYPRYLEAITVRMQKLAKNGAPRDQRSLEIINRCLKRFQQRSAEHAEREHFDPQLDYYGWMIQELRVSLFAQELGTAIPVSEVRLEKQWDKVSD